VGHLRTRPRRRRDARRQGALGRRRVVDQGHGHDEMTAQSATIAGTTAERVRPAGASLEGWALAAATLAIVGVLALYVRATGPEGTRQPLQAWQISAFDDLSGADQAIYN